MGRVRGTVGWARFFVVVACAVGSMGAQDSRPAAAASGPRLSAVPFRDVTITDETFWLPRLRTNRTVTLEANLKQCEETNRIRNFAVCAGLVKAPHEGALYNDSDVYKVLEGAAYSLALARDGNLEKRIDAIIDLIAAAQQKDGYLNTYWTVVKPGQRWTNIHHGHEMYCAGHLIEAAVAYAEATGKTKLLDVARRFADHIDSVFGPDKRHDCPGHEELELALVKLWKRTGDAKYLTLAKYFIDQRGHANGRELHGEYAQDHKPVREQTVVVGHAVRAMYLYCGMADVAAATNDASLMEALEAVWKDLVGTKMYLTGGIGTSASNEGFTTAFDLPNDTAYCETCAAIGMALWNHRMYLLTGDGKYADVLEREIYNGLLSGVSTSGDRFFYDNPLESLGQHERVPWFGCSCCPTNIVRYLPALGERIYARRGNQLDVVLYVASRATVALDSATVTIEQRTDYPWSGQVALTLKMAQRTTFDLRLRIPEWAGSAFGVTVNGAPVQTMRARGFVTISREWNEGDLVGLALPMVPSRVYARPEVEANRGRVALMRGPLVYCLEGVDHGGGNVQVLSLPSDAKLTAMRDLEAGLKQVEVLAHENGIVIQAMGRGWDVELHGESVGFDVAPDKLTAIPYFAWNNRGKSSMQVWIAETPEVAQRPDQVGTKLVNGVRVKASHCYPNDTVTAVHDGQLPKSSSDHSIPRLTFWDHRGTTEWVTVAFDAPRTLAKAGVYWFDDGPRGGCRVPSSWKLQWKDGATWKDATPIGGGTFGVAKDTVNTISIAPIKTTALRIEVTSRPEFSSGILEWTFE